MKKKNIVICIVVVVVLASMWLLFCPKALGNMSHDYAEATTIRSIFSFSGEADEKIKIRLVSDTPVSKN